MAKELRYTITGDARDFQRAMSGVDRSLAGSQKSVGKFNRVGATVGRGLAVGARIGAAGFAALGYGAFKSVAAFEEANKVAKQTDAVLKSTGGAANLTAKEIANLAGSISNKTGIDDEAIQSGENLLLTFTNIRDEAGKGNDIFSQTTKVMTDMSVALGQDTKSSAIQLGKALNDPIKGVTALQRVGVSFTEGQKEQIKTLVESGRTMDAQKLILRELNTEFGGSAEAAATPFDKLKVTLGNLQETIGGALAPAFEKAASFLNTFIKQVMSGTGPGGQFADVMRDVGRVIGEMARIAAAAWPQILSIGQSVFGGIVNIVLSVKNAITGWVSANRADISSFISSVGSILGAVRDVFVGQIIPLFQRMLPAIKAVFDGVVNTVRGAINIIGGILTLDFGKAWDGVKQIFSGALKVIGGIIRGFTAPFRQAASTVANALKDGFSAPVKAIADVVSAAFRTVKSIVGDVVQFVKDRLADVLSVYETVFRALSNVDVLGLGFEDLADSIGNAKDSLRETHDEAENLNRVSMAGLSSEIRSVLSSIQLVQSAVEQTIARIQIMQAEARAPVSSGGGGGGSSPSGPVTEKASKSSVSAITSAFGLLKNPGKGPKGQRLTALDALADLSRTDKDDMTVLRLRDRFLQNKLDRARKNGKAEDVQSIASELSGVRDEQESIRQGRRDDRKEARRRKRDEAAQRKPKKFTKADWLEAEIAKASITPDLADDADAAAAMLAYREKRYQKALAGGDPEKIAAAAQALQSAREPTASPLDFFQAGISHLNLEAAAGLYDDPATEEDETDAALLQKRIDFDNALIASGSLTGDDLLTVMGDLRNAMKENTETQRALIEAQRDQAAEAAAAQRADTDLRARIYAGQNGTILASIADLISGQIVGKAGLGFQTPSFAGGKSRY